MKKLATLILSATLLSSPAFGASDAVLATYKGGKVTEGQVMEKFQPIFDSQPNFKGKKFSDLDRATQESLVRDYINAKLVDEEIKKSGIEDSKEFQDKLAATKQNLAQQALIERQVKAGVTDAMIDAEYDKMVKEMTGQEEIKVSHILVKTEEEARVAKKKLSKGTKFADVAKEFSVDESAKTNGGTLGFFVKGQLVPEFSNKAFSMKVGEISDPVKTQFGWHIIKVEEKRAVKVPAKEEAKAGLVQKLSRDVVVKYLETLNSKADVKFTIPEEVKPKVEEVKK